MKLGNHIGRYRLSLVTLLAAGALSAQAGSAEAAAVDRAPVAVAAHKPVPAGKARNVRGMVRSSTHPVRIDGRTVAAPWPVQLPTALPQTPDRLVVYDVVSGRPSIDMDRLSRTFGLRGTPDAGIDALGARHLRDGQRHAFVYEQGSAVFHDVERLGAESRMSPLSETWLWQHSERLLDELGLMASGPVELEPARLGEHRIERFDGQGRSQGAWIAHQAATFTQRVDGLPAFGGGADVQLIYGAGGALNGFSHNVRPLEPGLVAPIDRPETAIARFLERAEREGRWSLNKAWIGHIDQVRLDSITLGYYVPDYAQDARTIEPVYEIRGTVLGLDKDGRATSIDLLWYEPASPDRSLPALGVYGGIE